MSFGVPLVEVVRSGLREGLHHGSVVALDSSGTTVLALGDVETPMFPRSANKPAQAVGMLRAGLQPATEQEVALAAASHSGESVHLALVREMLARHDLSEHDLRCPPAWPMDDAARGADSRGRATMECSGKHAAMLASCIQLGLSTEDYPRPDHPLQRSLHDTVAELAGEPIAAAGVDGCGAPLFGFSLTGLARTFARLTTAPAGTPERRVADAMREHPHLVAGNGRDDTALMRAVPGLVSKIGAEGVVAVALPDGRAVAVKIVDGAARARMPVLIGALRVLGVTDEALTALAEVPLFGGDQPVGTVRLLAGAFDQTALR